jgi:hypothetical protein
MVVSAVPRRQVDLRFTVNEIEQYPHEENCHNRYQQRRHHHIFVANPEIITCPSPFPAKGVILPAPSNELSHVFCTQW